MSDFFAPLWPLTEKHEGIGAQSRQRELFYRLTAARQWTPFLMRLSEDARNAASARLKAGICFCFSVRSQRRARETQSTEQPSARGGCGLRS
ncbi:MAG TPA: hypothetical protein DEH06_06915 [Alistipes sp.]|nr:hypothetical protein [Alistipes sp.]HCN14174.1 hypothetical protein [Alistipes sp.]